MQAASTTTETEDSATEDAITESDEEREERDNRFRTRMGARKVELDEETRQTLRLLNDARKPLEKPEQSTPMPLSIPVHGEPELPVVSAPVSSSTEVAPMETAPIEKTPIQVAPVEIAPVPVAPIENTDNEAVPAQRSTPAPEKPKPAAPRW